MDRGTALPVGGGGGSWRTGRTADAWAHVMTLRRNLTDRLRSWATGRGLGPVGRIIANAGWLTGGRLAGDLLGLVFFVFLARNYGPEGLGQYAYGLGIAGLVYAGVNLGVEDFAVRECARVPAPERGEVVGQLTVLQLVALLTVALVVVVFFITVSHPAPLIAIVVVLSVQQTTFALSKTLLAPAYAAQKMMVPALAELFFRATGIGVGLVLVEYYDQALSVGLLPLAVAGLAFLIFSAALAIREARSIKMVLGWGDAVRIIRMAWPFAASLILSYVSLRSSFVIMRMMLGDGPTGIYASGVKILEAAAMPLTFLGFAAYPRLSVLHSRDQNKFWASVDKLIRASLFGGALVAWGLLFAGPDVVVPLLGQEFVESADVVRSLAMLAVLLSLDIALVRTVLARNRQHARLAIQLGSVVVLLITTVAGIRFVGIYGAVAASYFAVITASSMYIWFLGKRLTSRLRKPGMGYAGALVLSGLAWWIGHALPGPVWLPATACLLVFLCWSYLSGLPPDELFQFLRGRWAAGTGDRDDR